MTTNGQVWSQIIWNICLSSMWNYAEPLQVPISGHYKQPYSIVEYSGSGSKLAPEQVSVSVVKLTKRRKSKFLLPF